jgi:hypothetical protein
MALRHRIFRELFPFFFFILLGLVIIPIMMHNKICQYPSSPFFTASSTSSRSVSLSGNIEEERKPVEHLWIWCPEIESHLDAEREILHSPQFRSPPVSASPFRRFPYHYSEWKSSSLLPRLISPCEHSIIMRLLMIIERICREHNLTFALSDGTLLGSWRHHDVIPWDDDVDLMMPIEDQLTFLRALEQLNETAVQYYLIEYPLDNHPYVKVFFQYTPLIVQTTWTFPFVDIFFYLTNKTHLWYSSHPNTNMKLEYVFPLVMRPFGYFWFPAPREPQLIFQFDAQNECNSHWHNHRKERGQMYVKCNCSDLIDVYPFVQRNKRTKSIEVLMRNHTIIHTIIYPH